jgi:hypothetical protein
MSVNKKKSALGKNPLHQGIFTQTEESIAKNQESRIKNQESIVNKKESFMKKEESIALNQDISFLNDDQKEKVNLVLPIALNDWLDDLMKKGKRTYGHKIPKAVWMQAALELFRSMPVDWAEVESIDQLREELKNLHSIFKKEE